MTPPGPSFLRASTWVRAPSVPVWLPPGPAAQGTSANSNKCPAGKGSPRPGPSKGELGLPNRGAAKVCCSRQGLPEALPWTGPQAQPGSMKPGTKEGKRGPPR